MGLDAQLTFGRNVQDEFQGGGIFGETSEGM